VGRQEELERVEQFAEEALGGLPEPLHSAAQELLVTVSHKPDVDLYGEFYGLPKGAEGGLGEPPPEVTLYAATLLADFPDADELRREVRRTLIHEIGHYLGLSEEDLHARGLE
jgi:predicted Zn-dependent protease with MMP-like domain